MPKNRIHKRSDGRYTYHATDKSSNRHNLTSRKGEGLRQFSRRCEDLDRSIQTFAGASDLTFDDLFAMWQRTHLSSTSSAHATSFQWIYADKIRPSFGRFRLSEITTQMAYEYLQGLASTGYSKSYVSKIRGCLSAPFRWALTSGLYHANPCDGLRLSYRTPAKINPNKALDQETLDRFFSAAADSKYQNYYRLLLLTGLRPSEGLGLQWADIKGDRIHISRGITVYETSRGKTDNAHRLLPVTDQISDILSAQRNPTQWLFPSSTGDPNAEAIKSAFSRTKRQTAVWRKIGRRYKAILEIPPVHLTLYSFRHTFATRCARAGMPPKTLQYLMGHESIEITLSYYVDIQDEDLDTAADIMSIVAKKGAEKGANSDELKFP